MSGSEQPPRLLKVFFVFFLCFLFFGCTIITLELYSGAFGRVEGDGPFDSWVQGPYNREEHWFYSGNNRLHAYIYGKDNTNGLVIISPGIYSYADEFGKIIRYMVDKNWVVFSYNMTGVDKSEGPGIFGISQTVLDLDAALTYIKVTEPLSELPLMLAGFCSGGYAVCAVLNYNHDITAVVSFAGFNKTLDVINSMAGTELGGIYTIFSPQVWALEKQIFGSIANLTAVDGINRSGIPVMIVHCSNDNVIPAHTISIYAARERITNPNIVIKYLEGEAAFGHFFKFHANEAVWEWTNDFFEKSLYAFR